MLPYRQLCIISVLIILHVVFDAIGLDTTTNAKAAIDAPEASLSCRIGYILTNIYVDFLNSFHLKLFYNI